MMLKIIAAPARAVTLAAQPVAGFVHAGHRRGKTAKKLKTSTAKQAAVGGRLRSPAA